MNSYEELVRARKSCTMCAGLMNPAHQSLSHFDGNEIGRLVAVVALSARQIDSRGTGLGNGNFHDNSFLDGFP